MPFGRFRRFGALRAVSGGFKVSCPSGVSEGFRRFAVSESIEKVSGGFRRFAGFRRLGKGFRRLTICNPLRLSVALCNHLNKSMVWLK